jgi:hypothetical protein
MAYVSESNERNNEMFDIQRQSKAMCFCAVINFFIYTNRYFNA